MTDKPRRILEEAQRSQIERRSKLPVAGATLYNDRAFTDAVREQIDASARFRQRLNETAGVVAIGGGGGGNASSSQATGGYGSNGGGGPSMTCQICGKQATRFANWSECAACNMKRCALAEPHDAHVRARAAQPAPAQSHCGCGASFATVKRFECEDGGTENYCGDCWSAKPGGALPDRIAAAQPKAVDADPTQAWGAGATPSYEWP